MRCHEIVHQSWISDSSICWHYHIHARSCGYVKTNPTVIICMKCAQLFAYSDLMKLCIHHNDLKIVSTYFGFVCSLLCLLTSIISIVMYYLSFPNMKHIYIMKCISLYLFMKFAVLLFALVFRLPEIRMLEIERRIAFWTRVSTDTSYISIFCKQKETSRSGNCSSNF